MNRQRRTRFANRSAAAILLCMATISLVLFASLSHPARAQQTGGGDDETPIGKRWWPSEYGEGDQRGAANRQGPAKVLEAAALIKTGKVYSLGRVYEDG